MDLEIVAPVVCEVPEEADPEETWVVLGDGSQVLLADVELCPHVHVD